MNKHEVETERYVLGKGALHWKTHYHCLYNKLLVRSHIASYSIEDLQECLMNEGTIGQSSLYALVESWCLKRSAQVTPTVTMFFWTVFRDA